MSGLSIKDGAEVECGGRRFIMMQLIGFDFVVARDIETDDLVRPAIVDLNPVSTGPSPVPALPDLAKVEDRDWVEARRRLDLIAPLLDGTRSPRAVIVERARAAGLDASTLYRWARAYRPQGAASATSSRCVRKIVDTAPSRPIAAASPGIPAGPVHHPVAIRVLEQIAGRMNPV